ncbi:MAG TPA: hypothetical protein VNZ49_00135 [Bacteroidia bacterium]|jgi:hypothetical protein|nr:hypothetical protein [Bacteroidia bacterium]
MRFYFIIPLHKTFFSALCLSLLFTFSVKAQTAATSSPYSRFALGRPENTGFASITAMGGSFTAFRNDTTDRSTFFINQGNPSSYAFNKYTSYEFGARYAYYTFSGKDGDVKKQNGGFNYISLCFPIRKKMGAAFGHVPFSNVGYNVTTTENVDSIGNITNNYQGAGGINQVYGGVAYRPFEAAYRNYLKSKAYKQLDSIAKNDTSRSKAALAKIRRKKFIANSLNNFSIGTNVSFLYGTINYSTRKYFPASFGSVFNTCDYTETQLHDVYVQGGTQISFDINYGKRRRVIRIDTICYNVNGDVTEKKPCCDGTGKTAYRLKKIYGEKKLVSLKNKTKITVGYTASLPKAVSASATHVGYNFTLASFGREIPFDTFSYDPNFKGRVYIPFMQTLGIGIKHGEMFTFLADVGYQQWSKFQFLGTSQGLKDQWRFSGGIQYQPSKMAIGTGAFFRRIMYRAGARYNTGYLFLKGSQINEYAVSAGLGLPVGKYRVGTMINITAEYGVAGTTKNLLVQEHFLRFVIGCTFNSAWFQKTRYD